MSFYTCHWCGGEMTGGNSYICDPQDQPGRDCINVAKKLEPGKWPSGVGGWSHLALIAYPPSAGFQPRCLAHGLPAAPHPLGMAWGPVSTPPPASASTPTGAKFKVGDKVRCVYSKNSGLSPLVLGQGYAVIGVYQEDCGRDNCGVRVEITGYSKGVQWCQNRFEIIASTPVAPKPVRVPKVYPQCSRCKVELSPYLDAYYGKVPGFDKMCTKCRDADVKQAKKYLEASGLW